MTTLEKFEIPSNFIKELEQYAKKAKKPYTYVKEIFDEFLTGEGMEFIAEALEDRCDFALEQTEKTLFSTLYIKGNAITVRIQFKVLHVSEVHDTIIKGKPSVVAYVTGVFETSDDAYAGEAQFPPSFGILSLLKDATQAVRDIHAGDSYRMDLNVKSRPFFMELSKYDYEQPDLCDITLPNPKDVILQAFEPINVREAEEHIGENRLICGTVTDIDSFFYGNDKIAKKIKLTDINNKKYKIEVAWFKTPEFADRCLLGKEYYVLAGIHETERYGLSARGRAIIPISETQEIQLTLEEQEQQNIEIFGEEWL